MVTQIGEIYMSKVTRQKIPFPNKTRKYLLPCLKDYGEEFMHKLDNAFKVAAGIGDIIVSNRGIKHEKHIFILFDTSIASDFFIDFLDWIKNQPMYQDDYIYGNIQKSKFHMIIVKLPINHYTTFETFKIGSYSKMYSIEEVNKFFKGRPVYRKVIVKDHKYKLNFLVELNDKFNIQGDFKIKPEEYDGELDFPPDKDEIFNNHITKLDETRTT